MDLSLNGHALKHLAVSFASVATDDGAHVGIRLNGGDVDPDTVYANKSGINKHLQDLGKDLLVQFQEKWERILLRLE